jgi:hypothetical protein
VRKRRGEIIERAIKEKRGKHKARLKREEQKIKRKGETTLRSSDTAPPSSSQN